MSKLHQFDSDIKNQKNISYEQKHMKLVAFLLLMRPQQWIKNAFVWAPLLFSRQFMHGEMVLKTMWAFISFCVVSSAIYAINDWCDRKEDQQHPAKRFRPFAAGLISLQEVITLVMILLAGGLALGWAINRLTFIMVFCYVVLNIAYSLRIKHLAILDVMTIAGGFVLRILGGAAAIGVAPSHWLVLCTIMISLFLGFTKRRAELVAFNSEPNSARLVLKDYSIAFLDQVIAMVTGATIVCYALYTVDARTIEVFGTSAMLLTVPSVIYGLLRYIYIIYHHRQGQDPTATLLRDIPTLINLFIWIIIAVLVVSYGKSINLFT